MQKKVKTNRNTVAALRLLAYSSNAIWRYVAGKKEQDEEYVRQVKIFNRSLSLLGLDGVEFELEKEGNDER